jgi:hypothetical protein
LSLDAWTPHAKMTKKNECMLIKKNAKKGQIQKVLEINVNRRR